MVQEVYACYYGIKNALRIGSLFGPTWNVPIALAFLALRPRRVPDEAMVEGFRPLFGKGESLSIFSRTRAEADIARKSIKCSNSHHKRWW